MEAAFFAAVGYEFVVGAEVTASLAAFAQGSVGKLLSSPSAMGVQYDPQGGLRYISDRTFDWDLSPPQITFGGTATAKAGIEPRIELTLAGFAYLSDPQRLWRSWLCFFGLSRILT